MSETKWLSAEQQKHWRSYLHGVLQLSERLDRDLREAHDLTLAEYEILVRLSEQPERRMRMAELASELAHSRSRMTHTISRLERAGIVLRQTCSNDGRGVEAQLTDQGFDLLAKAAHTHVRGVREHFVDVASPTEFTTIGTVMQKVAEELLAD